jgi:hypothetical protein
LALLVSCLASSSSKFRDYPNFKVVVVMDGCVCVVASPLSSGACQPTRRRAVASKSYAHFKFCGNDRPFVHALHNWTSLQKPPTTIYPLLLGTTTKF